jgi:RimJ/RimL family protein N-acetyltransferase
VELSTARLRIDALGRADAEAFFAYRSDPAVARFQGWCPDDLAEASDFIEAQGKLSRERPDGWMQRAIRRRDDGMLIGDLGVCLPDDALASVEFGISVAPAHQRRGYGREAAAALFQHGFEELGRHRIHASVDPRNLASMELLYALGMRQEAHHRQSLWLRGEWVDDVIFAMLADEWSAHRTAQAIAVKL